MAQRRITIKGATALVTPVGVRFTGADTASASTAIDRIAGATNASTARLSDDTVLSHRATLLTAVFAIARMGALLTKGSTPPKQAIRAGLPHVVVGNRAVITDGSTPAALTMALKRYGSAAGIMVRAVNVGGEILVYGTDEPPFTG